VVVRHRPPWFWFGGKQQVQVQNVVTEIRETTASFEAVEVTKFQAGFGGQARQEYKKPQDTEIHFRIHRFQIRIWGQSKPLKQLL
jgi:hypothetical protein